MPVLKAIVHIVYSIEDLFVSHHRKAADQVARLCWIWFQKDLDSILSTISNHLSSKEVYWSWVCIFSSVTVSYSHLVVFKVLLVLFDGFKDRWILETKVHRTLRIRILATITIYLVQFLKPPSCGKLKQEHWWQQHCRAPKGFRFLLSFHFITINSSDVKCMLTLL